MCNRRDFLVFNPRTTRKFPFFLVVFLAPAVICYTLFMIYPLIESLRMSFFSTTPENKTVFAGIANYVKLLTDSDLAPRFWGALRNNFVFFIIHMLVQNPIGLLLASLLVSKGKGRSIYRTLLYMPNVLSVVIIGFIWQLILNPLWGVSESILRFVGLGKFFQPWLGLPEYALPTIALISVWQFIGIPMLLFYTALIGIPKEFIEASLVDGCTERQVFWRIKFPLMLPTVGIVSILTFVGNFNAFDLIYTMKGASAGPAYSTDIMGTLFYRTFFGQQLQLGNPNMGATVASMMFLIILFGVLLYTFAFQRRVKNYQL
ncbi:MAG: raffinose/stachyose/melibiose transport system permease protein [Verrucomicrobiota bacterium]|jgi:raffinose/stachyose/melibiose transport system permease protein|nr:raffinose/stachyose/melibiose transport system permease protein [Verrucomicrobiota bacterium]MDK2964074.1 raffinose/stachyose/melibiose transport system permease protein [Verrucomicrobiota bacterium]